MCVTEERVREIFREEREKKQEGCRHEVRGTIQADGSLTCDTCGKELQK